MAQDLLITIPKTVKWLDYEKELVDVISKKLELNFKVRAFPKGLTFNESKIYVTHNGVVKGYMILTDFKEDSFECQTTGQLWSGKFLVRSGRFFYVEPITVEGFRGYRYFNYDEQYKKQFG